MAKKAADTQPKKSAEQEQAELEAALDKLSPQEAEMFVRALELTMKKRRIMMFGYLSAALLMVIGFLWAFYMYGTHDQHKFIGWVFLVPFTIAGISFIVFGRIAKGIKK